MNREKLWVNEEFFATLSFEPYCMCTKEECDLRQRTAEISLLERAKGSHKLAHQSSSQKSTGRSTAHIIDPRFAVAKYRRSAAGRTDHFPPRSASQLERTVDYCGELLCEAPTTGPDGNLIPSYMALVEFATDRLRAVQVECVRLEGEVQAKVYVKMARLYILLLYLLSDVPGFSEKLACDALQAVLSGYWDARDRKHDEETLVMTLFLGLRPECSLESFQHVYRKYASCAVSESVVYKKALSIFNNWAVGNWTTVLQQMQAFESSTGLLARCLVARLVPWVWWHGLQAYNISFMKAEKLDTFEVLRIFQVPIGTKEAELFLSFCVDHGLERDEDGVSFKTNKLDEFNSGARWKSDMSWFVFPLASSRHESTRPVLVTKNSIMSLPSPKAISEIILI